MIIILRYFIKDFSPVTVMDFLALRPCFNDTIEIYHMLTPIANSESGFAGAILANTGQISESYLLIRSLD